MEPAVKLCCDALEWSAKNAPHFRPINVCANHMNAAGAGSNNAIAYTISNAFTYMDELISRGLTVDQITPLMLLFNDEREDFFVTAALGRATRKVWAAKIAERYDAKTYAALNLRTRGYSHGGETLVEALNNIFRIGSSSLAYYLGGTQFISNASYDEASSTPNSTTAKVCIRTSQIINNEHGYDKVIDPLAGSYYVESLTMDIANDITKEIDKIQSTYGGSMAAIKAGYYASSITKGAIRRQREFEAKERLSVGVNVFKSDEALPRGSFRVDPAIEKVQLERLKKLKATRNNARVKETLQNLKEVSAAGKNTMDALLDAVRAYATIGEVCNVWREIFGEYRPQMITF